MNSFRKRQMAAIEKKRQAKAEYLAAVVKAPPNPYLPVGEEELDAYLEHILGFDPNELDEPITEEDLQLVREAFGDKADDFLADIEEEVEDEEDADEDGTEAGWEEQF